MKKSTIFFNRTINKKELKKILSSAFIDFGKLKTSFLATKLKDLGFYYATKAGISLSIEDLRVPSTKTMLMKTALKKVDKAGYEADQGKITEVERYQKVINIWNTTSEALKERVVEYFQTKDPLNSVYMMAFSGARGNVSQVRQLVGMRGLMADPSGQIIDIPIKANFKEGLTVSDYIISSYGARKGLVDTALRTADSGYLTRRLVDVAQDVVTREYDCKTKFGIRITNRSSIPVLSIEDKILGRVLATTTINKLKKENIPWFTKNSSSEITIEVAKNLSSSNFSKIVVRSPLTCELARAVCQKCYGWDLTLGNLVDLGVAVGIIAGQSIGEPGTQLTMRTFHTGGVFTSEPSRQIRSDTSGKILFSLGFKTKETRSKFGELVLRSENLGSIELTNYKNKKKILKVPPDSLMFVKNLSFIKKDESLFELPVLTRKTKEAKNLKDVRSLQSGEVLIKQEKFKIFGSALKDVKNLKKNTLVWVFSGKVYSIPGQSNLQIQPPAWIQTNQSLSQSKVSTFIGGNIKILTDLNSGEINSLEVYQFPTTFKNLKIYIETHNLSPQEMAVYGFNRCVLYLDLEKNVSSPSKKDFFFQFGELKNNNFTTKTGGTFYCTEIQITNNIINTVFYVPEFVLEIKRPSSELKVKVKSGQKILKGDQYLKNKYSKFDGIIEIKETSKIIDEIVIKPGYKIPVPLSEYSKASSYHEQVFFTGERLFEFFEINQCSYIELKKLGEDFFLLISPVVRYEIYRENKNLKHFSSSSFRPNQIKLGQGEVSFISGQKIKSSKPVEWLTYPLLLKENHQGDNIMIEAKLFQLEIKPWFELLFTTREFVCLKSLLPKQVKKENLSFYPLVENGQYVEVYTILALLQILSSAQAFIYSIKEQFFERKKRVLLTTNQDYKSFYFEDRKIDLKLNNFFKPGNKLCNSILPEVSGLIDKIQGNQVLIRLGQPYLFSLGGEVQICNGYFIKKEETLGQLFYTRARTEDIVQGLPKVEELLEARKSNFVSILAKRPGMVSQVSKTSSSVKVWVSSAPSEKSHLLKRKCSMSKYLDLYSVKHSSHLIVSLGQFINVAQPLENKGTNPNSVLDIYFHYYQNLEHLSLGEAAFRSIQVAQAVILSSVQNVYSSQGVTISDKHLEIIVRQMTKKIEIVSPGDTNLLQKEYLDFSQVHSINTCVKSSNKPFYKPILLGITKAALKTDSFLSKASFQQTTQVLTEAAIEGKTDWLRGLKENVITGSVIPAGTGFYSYIDLSYLLITVPPYKDLSKYTKFSKNFQIKYTKLRKDLDFKLTSTQNYVKKSSDLLSYP